MLQNINDKSISVYTTIIVIHVYFFYIESLWYNVPYISSTFWLMVYICFSYRGLFYYLFNKFNTDAAILEQIVNCAVYAYFHIIIKYPKK